jgi:hypothetical protein
LAIRLIADNFLQHHDPTIEGSRKEGRGKERKGREGRRKGKTVNRKGGRVREG